MKKMIVSSVLAGTLLFSGVAAANAPNQYIATDSDTLWTVSQKLNIKLSDLVAANPNLDPQNIYAGVVIHLPRSTAQKQSWEAKADAVIATGLKQLGTPYVFGGDTPYVAFDCSGFVQYAFNQNGFNLPHSAALISQMGTPVNKSDLRKGDLVFLYGTYTRGVSHVAIYLGNNKILHASTYGGTKEVKITPLFGTPYYDAHYWGARRLIH